VGRLVFCNRAFAELLGYEDSKDLIGQPVTRFYRDERDRRALVKALSDAGFVKDMPLGFIGRNGTALWCATSAKAVFDDNGTVVLINGAIRKIGGQGQEEKMAATLDDVLSKISDFILIIDFRGEVLGVNNAFAEFLGFSRDAFLGKQLVEFIAPEYRNPFPLLFFDVLQSGRQKGILTVSDRSGTQHHLGFNALLVQAKDGSNRIKIVASDITERIKQQEEQLNKEKLLGVMEMAGGVAHRLNQPLTIISNILTEVLSDLRADDHNYQKLVRIDEQLKKLTEIARKIRGIKKYEAMDYVAGVKIVDIDKASTIHSNEESEW
jgi:PAS domain S-box-containing protein